MRAQSPQNQSRLPIAVAAVPLGPETWPGGAAALVAIDARFKPMVEHGKTCRIEIRDDPFETLCLIIMYQQISGRAAEAIAAKVRKEHPTVFKDPAELVRLNPVALQAFGIPVRRVQTMRTMAQHVLDGRLDLQDLRNLPDEQVREKLQAISGLGPWSAGMFLLFHLGRQDVFLPGDLGLRKAIAKLVGGDVDPRRAEEVAEAWRPWRSVAMWYLWHTLPEFPTPGVR